MGCLLSIDLGTSSVKAVVMSADGAVIASESKEYPISSPSPGWAEQDPELWWSSAVEAVRKVSIQHKESIRAIGLSGQMHGTVLLGKDAAPLYPAVIWPDLRSQKEVREIQAAAGEALLGTEAGTAPAPGFMGPTLLWLKKHMPDVFQNTAQVILPKDYLLLRLTGEISTDVTDASGTGLFNNPDRTWSTAILEKIGLPEKIFPESLQPEEIPGSLRRAAAEELGLKPGIPVASGCADQTAQAVGNGIREPGTASITVGSGGQIFLPLDTPAENNKFKYHVFCHAPKDRWYILGAMLTAGLSLRWLRDFLYPGHGTEAFEQMSGQASKVPPGAGSLFFLPYLAGERSPIMDPDARGCFIGLTLSHTREHLCRAVMEGTAFALRQILETLEANGCRADFLKGAGGGLNDPVWRQITADVLGRPIAVSPCRELTGRGAACIAGIGAGIYSGYDAVPDIHPGRHESAVPDQNTACRYNELYNIWTGIYPELKGLFTHARRS